MSAFYFFDFSLCRKKIRKIGKYNNVEILKVTKKGIQISHADGICCITEDDLSDGYKKILSSEIEQYHKLKNSHIIRVAKLRKQQSEELKTLITKIPQMTPKELQSWSKKRLGVYFNDENFPTRFNSAFYYADNKAAFQKAFEERMPKIYNDYLENLSKKLCQKTPDAIDKECRRLFGIKYSDRNFRQKLKKKMNYATNFDSFFSRIDKSIKIYNQKRQREVAEQRRKQKQIREQAKKQKLNSMYHDILQMVKRAKSQNTLSDNQLTRLIQLRGQVRDTQKHFSLSQAQSSFLKHLDDAGECANLYFTFLKIARFHAQFQQFDKSEQLRRDAGKAKDNAMKMLEFALDAYNSF